MGVGGLWVVGCGRGWGGGCGSGSLLLSIFLKTFSCFFFPSFSFLFSPSFSSFFLREGTCPPCPNVATPLTVSLLWGLGRSLSRNRFWWTLEQK